MAKAYCELSFASESSRVRCMVDCLLSFLNSYAPAPDVRDDLKLIFSELLYNAVIHGNKEDCTKTVNVRLETIGTKINAFVRDEGPGFDYGSVIECAKRCAEKGNSLQNERGRGMLLVDALTDNLSFNETGNVIRFEKRLK